MERSQMTNSQMKDLLAGALRGCTAEYCEIRYEETRATQLSMVGEQIQAATITTSVGGSVRALDGAWGFVCFNGLEELPRRVEEACSLALRLSASSRSAIGLSPIEQVEDDVPGDFVWPVFSVSLRGKVDILTDYARFARSLPGVSTCGAWYQDSHSHVYLATSEGTYVHQEKMDLTGGINPIFVRGSDKAQLTVSFGSSRDFGVLLNLEDEMRDAAATASQLPDAPAIRGGEYAVVLGPDIAGNFIHEAFGHISEADNMLGNEGLREVLKVGNQFGSSILNVYDSGTKEGNRGECMYDDEGVPTRTTYLIRAGRLAGHLHSRETAWSMGVLPTGNARAVRYNLPPLVRMRATCIAPGSDSLDEMLRETNGGIYVAGVRGGETRSETFTFRAAYGRMIEGGRLGRYVKDVALMGNVFETLRKIDMVGDDFRFLNGGRGCGKRGHSFLPVSTGAPHIRINGIVVAGGR